MEILLKFSHGFDAVEEVVFELADVDLFYMGLDVRLEMKRKSPSSSRIRRSATRVSYRESRLIIF